MTLDHPDRDLGDCFEKLRANKVSASLRQNRAGKAFLRFSPHFYNTDAEVERVAQILGD